MLSEIQTTMKYLYSCTKMAKHNNILKNKISFGKDVEQIELSVSLRVSTGAATLGRGFMQSPGKLRIHIP